MRVLSGGTLNGPLDTLAATAAAIQKMQPYLDVMTKVLEDPALPEVIKRARILIEMHKAEEAAAQTPQTKGLHGAAFGAAAGIGLYKAIRPLDAYIYYKRNRWVLPVGIIGAVLIPLSLGLVIGRATAPSTASRTRH